MLQKIATLLEPAHLWTWAVSHYLRVCLEEVLKGHILAPIFQTKNLRDESFARFWLDFSAFVDKMSAQFGLRGSSALIPPILETATGIVLDIGPGTGPQMPYLCSPAIKAIYGPEPCLGLHRELKAKATSEGLGEKYYVLLSSVATEELLPTLRETGTGVVDSYDENPENGIFDTIVCVRVLCSVPDVNSSARELYKLLRPGGRLLVTEHVVNPWRTAKGSLASRIAQGVYQLLGWSFFIGDCAMDRDTESALRRAGEWSEITLERSFESSPMPYLSGSLVKA
ncbi:hypothetical protein N7495_000949 [Penicillium taxi]|uniref:uncharacterized protein n=1 Tax=Penicillium taxi TaxID=168475 RepID=UPI0025457ED0|nr:uncharacterized protein N7495_000949 [Penicillium taxi]KAJ5908267.1 hypothetical protein N7495_000949 [Penicillium taxi]